MVTSGSTAIIDFKRNKHGMPATVREIEYDPNRSARIALVEYEDGEKRYILHPKGLAVGDTIVVGPGLGRAARQRAAAAARSRSAPTVHNVELKIGKGGQICRSAGMSAQVMAKEGEYVTLRMPSTEMRLVHGSAAWRRSARSATPSTSSSRGARRARAAGWAGARRFAARS